MERCHEYKTNFNYIKNKYNYNRYYMNNAQQCTYIRKKVRQTESNGIYFNNKLI